MLQNIRDNSQSWVAKAIVGVIILLMALTGFDAIVSAGRNKDDAASVNGDAISGQDVRRAMEMHRQQLQRQLGAQFNPEMLDEKAMRRTAVENLVQRMLVLQGARNAGLAFSSAALDQLILATPEFQVDGKFNAARFDQAISRMGYGRQQFRDLLTQEMLMTQLRAGIAGSGFMTEREIRDFAALERQTRDFSSLVLKPDASTVKVTDEQLKAWYDQHASEFMTPEQVVIEYVQLKKEDFFGQVSISEQAVRDLYARETAAIGEQRKASHILLETSDKLNDEQARSKLEELRQRVLKGEGFAALARQFSADPGSAASGGDLGFAGRGVYDPAFETALYALKKGELSAPVKSEFGWHLIRLDDVQAANVPTLEAMRPQLEAELKSQAAEQRFVEASKALETAAYESSDLQQPAQELKLKVQQSKPFSREGGEGVTGNRQVIQTAFSEDVLTNGANSQVLELDAETAVVLRVKEHLMPRQQALAELADKLRQRLRDEQAAKAVSERGQALLADLRAGKAVSGKDGWKRAEAAGRTQDGIDPQVLQAAFRMPSPAAKDKPVFSGVQLRNGDFVVLRLDGVNSNSESLSADEINMFRRFLSSRSGQNDFDSYQRQLAVDAKVEYY